MIDARMKSINDALKTHQTTIDVNLDEMYGRAVTELTLQQTKRDQIIASYLTVLTLVTTVAMTSNYVTDAIRGYFFLAAGFIGVLLALIIIRYRVYKEAYWLCCQSLSVMFGYKKEELNKAVIQNIYKATMLKKGKKFVKEVTVKNTKVLKLRKWFYFWKNLFSAETIYLMIQALICAAMCLLGTLYSSAGRSWEGWKWPIGIAAAAVVFVGLVWYYFEKCIGVYAWLAKNDDASFNEAFGKAWFLHFYHDNEDDKKDGQKDEPKDDDKKKKDP